MSLLPLDALANRIRLSRPAAGSTTVVAIDGPAGSGKTSLAERLAARLDCAVVHMDDIYPGWDGLAEAAGRIAEQVLVPLAESRPVRYQRYDWHRGEYAEWVEVPRRPTLIIEGCGSGSTPGSAYLSMIIWVEAPYEVRMARGIARDGDTFRPYWERWARQEDALFTAERTRERANLVIDTAADLQHDPDVEVVVDSDASPAT